MTFSIKKKTLRKIVSSLTMFATVVSMSGMMALSTVVAADAVADGALIKSDAVNSDGTPTYESLDIYIVKIVGTKQFKRLMLNPTVFESYGHLNYGDVQTITQAEMDTYTTSSLVRVDTDPDEKVYAMAPDGDIGSKAWVNLTSTQFVDEAGSDPESIYTINSVDGGNYTTVGDVTTVTELTDFYSTGDLPDITPVPVEGELAVALSATTPASSTLVAGQAVAPLADFVLTGTGTVTGVTLKRIGVSADATLSNLYLFDGETRITDAASISAGSVVTFTAAAGLFEVDGAKTISVRSDIAAGTSGQTVGIEITGVTLTAGVVTGLPVSGNIHSIASATLATVAMSAATGSGNVDAGTGILVWQGTATVGTRDVLLNRLALRQVGSIVSADINNFRLSIDGTEVATVDSLDASGYVTFAVSEAMTSGARVMKVYADVIGGAGRTVQMSLRGAYDITTVDTQYNANVLATGTFPFGPSAFTVNSGTMTVVKDTDSQSANITTGAPDISLGKYTFTAFGEPIKVETLSVSQTYSNAGYTAPVTAVAQVNTITPTAVNSTAYTITIDGDATPSSYTSDADATVAEITAGLTAAINADAGAAAVTAADGTTVLTITADTAGTAFTIAVGGNLVNVATTANVAGVTQVGTLNAAATLRNGRIMVDGSQVGSTTTLAAASTSFTTNFVVTPGTPVTVEIRSDVFDNDGTGVINDNDTVVASLLIGSGNAVPQTSLGTINVPTATVAANTLTISTGSMSIATTSSYPAQTTAVPVTAYKIGSFQLSGNATEAVNLNTIYVGFTSGSTVTEATDLSDLYVVYGGTTSSVKGTVSSTILNGNSWSISETLAKNATMQIDVYATLASSVSTNAIISTLAVAGITADSSTTTYADASGSTTLTAGVTGQTITGGTGSITASLDASTAIAQIVADTGTIKTLTSKFVTITDAYTITDMVVTVSNASAVSTVTLKDHTTGVVLGASKPGATSLTWSGLTIDIDANKTKVIDVELALTSVGVGAGTSGAALTTAITGFTARNSAGTSAAGTGSATGNAVYVYAATPTIVLVDLPSLVLGTGTQTVSKFKVASNGGTIGWKKFIFTVTRAMSGADTLATPTLWDGSTQIAGTAAFTGGVEADGGTAGTITFVATTEQQISADKTYALKLVTAGTFVDGDNINVSIAQPSSYVSPDDYTAVAATTSSFTWSDISGSGHDATSTTVLDWNNDYLVNGLPTDTQSLSK